jgi:hypothetical protein
MMQAGNSVKSLGFDSPFESVVYGIGAMTWPIVVRRPGCLISLSTTLQNHVGRIGLN